MRLFKYMALAAGFMASTSVPSMGRVGDGNILPQEFPPTTYTGRQYVDSKGCVFIRVEVDGFVDWVPRVTRSRKHVCGMKPTQLTPQNTSRSAPKQDDTLFDFSLDTPASEPASASQGATARPKPRPTKVAKAAPKKVVKPKVSDATRPVIASQPVVSRKPKVTSKPRVAKATQTTASKSKGLPVRVISRNDATRLSHSQNKRVMKCNRNAAGQLVNCRNYSPQTEATTTIIQRPGQVDRPVRVSSATQARANSNKIAARILSGPSALNTNRQVLRCRRLRNGDVVDCKPFSMDQVSSVGPKTLPSASYNGTSFALLRATAVNVPAQTAQAGDIVTFSKKERSNRVVAQRVVTETALAPETHIMPRAAYNARMQSLDVLSPPEGQQWIWDDDRLNPNRGLQTLAGKQQMELRWTNTVPRRLYNVVTGEIVTDKYPNLKYPDTGVNDEESGGATFAGSSAGFGEGGSGPSVSSTLTRIANSPTQGSSRSRAVQRGSKPTKIFSAPLRSPKYVHLGTYVTGTHAQDAIARMHRLGLPVAVKRFSKNGKSYETVVSGPFGNTADLNRALQKAKRAGFSTARLR